ncbi:unnamed protein product, partial [Effrenium voratum]
GRSEPFLRRFSPDHCEAPAACPNPASRHIARWRGFQEGQRRSAEAPEGTELEVKRPVILSASALGYELEKPSRAAKYQGFSERVPVEEVECPKTSWRTTYQDALPDAGAPPERAAKYAYFSERMPVEEPANRRRQKTSYQ